MQLFTKFTSKKKNDHQITRLHFGLSEQHIQEACLMSARQ